MVDDALMFLSYLVKAPALPANKPSCLPTPIVILAETAASALLPSPSSTHSRSTTSGHARNGKGTPSSVRSFGSRVSAGAFAIGREDSSGSSKRSYRHFLSSGMRGHSRNGEIGTPRSHNSVGGGGKGAGINIASGGSEMSAGRHAAVDADALVELSVEEMTRDGNTLSVHE